MARTTLVDIAKKAGVSRTTVSDALNNNPKARISPETRERIMRASRELNYQPNLVAKGLRIQKSNTIGVMVVNMMVRVFLQSLKGIQTMADQHQYHVLLADTQGIRDKEIDQIKFLSQKSIDGLIVIAATRYVDSRLPSLLNELLIPAVFVNQPLTMAGTPLKAPTVLVDYEGAMYEAVCYLRELGHRSIGFLGADLQNLSVKLRRDGYLRAMADSGIAVQPEWLVAEPEGLSTYQFGERSLPRLIESGITAIVAVNDAVAAGAMHAAQRLGIKVPKQLSVIGHDDQDPIGFLRPTLTTVRHPLEDLGANAFKVLLKLIEDPNWTSSSFEPVVLSSKLVVRESTATHLGGVTFENSVI